MAQASMVVPLRIVASALLSGLLVFLTIQGTLSAAGDGSAILSGVDGGDVPPIIAEADDDSDVDGLDLFALTQEFDRTDCNAADPCHFDLDADGDVDETDLYFFAGEYGRALGGDCTDSEEICDDGIDNDCDGLTDCQDDDCVPFCGGGVVIQANRFVSDSEGYAYQDDLFRSSSQPAYAKGRYVDPGGYSGGGLEVTLGGVDASGVTNGMSGGWSTAFTLNEAGAVTIYLRYRLRIAGEYEADEYSQVLVSVDGNLIGVDGGDHLFVLVGADEITPDQDSGWRTESLQLSLGQGVHTLAVGAWNNKKTGLLEETRAYFDDIVIYQTDTFDLLFAEDFSSGDLAEWTVEDESDAWPSDWQIVSGEYRQLSARVDDWQKNYHLGSFSHCNQGAGWTDYGVAVKMKSLAGAPDVRDSMGVMFRYQGADNYYRFLMSRMQGIRRLEKKTNGEFTTLAFDGRGFSLGQQVIVKVIVEGSKILVYANDEILFSAEDSDHSSGTIALFTQGPSSFDDVEVSLLSSAPRLVISDPGAYTVAATDAVSGPYGLNGAAVVLNLLSGNGVKFIRDGGTSGQETCLDYSAPFTTSSCGFSDVPPGEHALEALVVDSAGQPVSDPAGLDRDINGMIGFGGKYVVAFGDSISNGVGDEKVNDDNSENGKNLSRGFTPPLNDLLSTTFGVPVAAYNEGLGGTTSIQGVSRINETMAVHPHAQLWLIMFGTNDSGGTLPLDKAGFKNNMAQIIAAIQAAGHIPALAKVPFMKNATSLRNSLIQDYNDAIDELTQGLLPVASPDFYSAFQTMQDSWYSDDVHPNGAGYQAMAVMWRDVIVKSGIFE